MDKLFLATLITLIWLIPLLKNRNTLKKRHKQLLQHLLHDLTLLAEQSKTTCTCQQLQDFVETLYEDAGEEP